MFQETSAALPSIEHPDALARWLAVGAAVASALILFVTTGMLVVVLVLMDDAYVLREEIRQTSKEAEAMRAEVADIAVRLEENRSPSVAASDGSRRDIAAVDSVPRPTGYGAAAHPVKVRADAPTPVCVFRAGNGDSLANCIKRSTKS